MNWIWMPFWEGNAQLAQPNTPLGAYALILDFTISWAIFVELDALNQHLGIQDFAWNARLTAKAVNLIQLKPVS